MALTFIFALLVVCWFAGSALDRLFNRLAGYDNYAPAGDLTPAQVRTASLTTHFKSPRTYLSHLGHSLMHKDGTTN